MFSIKKYISFSTGISKKFENDGYTADYTDDYYAG